MLQAGPCNAMGVWILDRPGSLPVHLHEIRTAIAGSGFFRETLKKFATWHFWQPANDAADLNLADHVLVLEDTSVKTLADFSRLLEKIRRLELEEGRPRWKAFLLNPKTGKTDPRQRTGGQKNEGETSECLHAFVLYFDHAIGDGIRIERFVRDMNNAGPAPGATTGAGAHCQILTRSEFDALPEDKRILLSRLALFSVPKKRLRKARPKGLTSTQFVVDAAADILATEDFYQPTSRQTHRALVTTAIKTGEVLRQGNFFKAAEYDAVPFELRGKVAKPTTGRDSTWRQTVASPLPAFLLKAMLGFWYRQFDVMLNVIPAASRNFNLGGARVVSGFGVPPVLQEMPLTIDMIGAFGQYHFTLLPGKACSVDAEQMAAKFAEAVGGNPENITNTRDQSLTGP
jgi:hypothetical protein